MPNNLVLPKPGSKPGSKSSSRSTSKQRQLQAPLSFAAAVATLTLGKASRVFAAFVSFHYLQDRVALPLYLFFVTLGAAATLLALQQPWNGKRIGQKRGRRVLIAGAILALTLYTWTAGLRSAGPLRTLLIDGAELPLLYLFAVVSRREVAERRKTRGAICMLLAYLLVIWDASGHVPALREIEKSKIAQQAESTIERLANKTGAELSHIVHIGSEGGSEDRPGSSDSTRQLETTFKPPVEGTGSMRDAFIEGTGLRCEFGVVLVLVASIVMQWSRGFTRRLATELGGAKRHFALSTTAACGWLSPLAMASWVSSSSGAVLSLSVIGGITRMEVTVGHVVGFVMVGFLWLVLPYYVRAIVSTAVPQRMMMQSGVVVPFLMAGATSVVFGAGASAGGLSWILVAAFVLDCVGISMMMAGGVKRSLSELPIDSSGASRTSMGQEGAVADESR